MKYYSTNGLSGNITFRDAVIRGQAPDRGLYFPEQIPKLDKKFIEAIGDMPDAEIAYRVIRPYIGNTIPDEKLFAITKEVLNFPIPLVKIRDDIFSLELFHGPTLAFKDVGARFMSRCLGYFVGGEEKKVTVLVATSGDTGGAVADGFYGVDGVEVVILYPSGKVSEVQEKQLTTHGSNIRALEIEGSFDDCQQMVKQAFADSELNKRLFLTSANSINVARWLPQQFYYFLAWKQWPYKEQPPVISVPSGNFGNICAGMLAAKSGLPVAHFIAACNANDTVTTYLETGTFPEKKAVPTLSNAMDVANPSNFVRILELYEKQYPLLTKNLSSYSISDDETRATIERLYRHYGYISDPHGAVGYLSLERWMSSHPGNKGIFLETAHPVKFPGAVQAAIGKEIVIPEAVKEIMFKEKKSLRMQADFDGLKSFLLGS